VSGSNGLGGAGYHPAPRGARLRALLAALLINANIPVSADMLAEAVWDGASPPAAVDTLRSYVRRLRRELGAEGATRIVARDPGYLIRVADDELDLIQFDLLCRQASVALRDQDWERASDLATRAQVLWRGDPLCDIPSHLLRDQVVPRLEQLFLQALQDRVEADLWLGRHDRLVPDLHGLTNRYPLREQFHFQLMLALSRSGHQAEALEAYRTARRILVDELGVEPGPQLRELHQRILAGDPEPREATRDNRDTPPRQLPAAPRHFIGRRNELEVLVGRFDESGPAGGTVLISAIDGMAGIGKTALAVDVAHRLAEKFPDGQLFADLHGYTAGHLPRTPIDVLQWLLRALGEAPGRIPQELEECSALYRQRLADTRTLILLDNAFDEAQIRPLLPGSSSCLVLVTSRRRLKGLDDARSLSLDVLPQADAVALLRAVAGPGRINGEDPAAHAIVDMCGRLPLAVRIAAALLRHRPAWTLAHLAGLLREQGTLTDGERSLDAVFTLSYERLDEARRRLFRWVGLIPGPQADALAVAAMLQCDPATAGRLLEDLVDHNLLSAPDPGRYRLHDLLRSYARALAGADVDALKAQERLLDYYQHTANRAELLIRPYHSQPPTRCPAPLHAPALPDAESAWRWLRTERLNLLAAIDHATAAQRVVGLTQGVASLLRTDGPWLHAERLHAAAARLAARDGNISGEAASITALVRIQVLLGNYPEATANVTEALERYQETGDHAGRAAALSERGLIRAETGLLDDAVLDLREAQQVYEELGDRRGQATAQFRLGSTMRQQCSYAGAIVQLRHALLRYTELGERHGQANAHIELGRIRLLNGDYPGAIDDLTRARHLHRELGDRHGQASVALCLGQARTATGDYQGAVADLDESLRLYQSLASPLGRASALAQLGTTRRLQGDHSGALRVLEEALAELHGLGVRGGEAWALTQYAAAVRDSGELDRAMIVYEQALAMCRETRQSDDEAVALEGIAECHRRAGHPERGAGPMREALVIYERLGMVADVDRLRSVTVVAEP
jgi:DNA-binding SARP family transcriptional activator